MNSNDKTPPAAGQAKALPQRWTADGDMITAPTGNIADCCDAETAAFIVIACNAFAMLAALADRWDKRADEAERNGDAAADAKNWGDARENMANATAYAQCAADLRAALAAAKGA